MELEAIEELNVDVEEIGPQGYSAYEVYVQNGGTLSEVEWLNSLKGVDGTNGKDGTDGSNGITPIIGDNGNWYLGETDTGKPSRGEQGPQGFNGITPSIGDNGNWYLGDVDTGLPSRGEDASDGVMILAEDSEATKIEKLLSVIENGDVVRPLFYRGNNEELYITYSLYQSYVYNLGRAFVFSSMSYQDNIVCFTISNDNELIKEVINIYNTVYLYGITVDVVSESAQNCYNTTEIKEEFRKAIQSMYYNGTDNIILHIHNSSGGGSSRIYYNMKTITKKPTYISFMEILNTGTNRINKNGVVLNGSTLMIYCSWDEDIVSVDSITRISENNVMLLSTANTTSYTPTSPYHPATKQYVDDSIAALKAELTGTNE